MVFHCIVPAYQLEVQRTIQAQNDASPRVVSAVGVIGAGLLSAAKLVIDRDIAATATSTRERILVNLFFIMIPFLNIYFEIFRSSLFT